MAKPVNQYLSNYNGPDVIRSTDTVSEADKMTMYDEYKKLYMQLLASTAAIEGFRESVFNKMRQIKEKQLDPEKEDPEEEDSYSEDSESESDNNYDQRPNQHTKYL